MIFENVIIITDYIALVYSLMMYIVFFIFVISSALSFSKYIKSREAISQLNLDDSSEYIPVSLIVPSYNEEVTIVSTIESLISLNYEEYEIIIVNDGSTDNTLEILKKEYNLNLIYKPMKKIIDTKDIKGVYKGRIRNKDIILIDKENGGKADALNVGINYSKYPVFVSIDADSLLEKNAIQKIIIPFMENKKTVAVGGNIKISNFIEIIDGEVINHNKLKGILIPFQIIEYLRAFLTNRMAWNSLNMNLIISGAFGAFNKKIVTEVGGYKTNTVGEDMELVMRIHKYFLNKKEKYYIAFAPDANCYTQTPDTLKGLKTQRRRWQMGLIQSINNHKDMFIDKKWFLAKSYFIFFELITPILELFGMVIITISFFIGLINLDFLLIYYLTIMIYSTLVSISAILLDIYVFKENINIKITTKLIVLSIFESIGYRQLISLYRISAFIGYSKNKHKWGSIKRKVQNKTTA
ncbi:glycosyltransferase family 2 protein [[Clostridium] dakarense]|uniref:glycosyltransferase family 2 protein n=1 Tax=Faecalimicrobium dakarense TaxID=1301100 RepID=UPI0004B97A39|nr:glycosyltransferase [[Clostridium] dakarense]